MICIEKIDLIFELAVYCKIQYSFESLSIFSIIHYKYSKICSKNSSQSINLGEIFQNNRGESIMQNRFLINRSIRK